MYINIRIIAKKKKESLLYTIQSESVSHLVISDSAIPWTVARQAPLSMELSRQEYWSG